MNTTVVGVLLAAAILGSSGLIVFDSQVEKSDQLNEQFNTVMNETMSFLDHSWEIAQKFQNISYNYDPSELGDFSIPEVP